MKLFAILLSITVGILSVVLFREHILETASALYGNLAIFTNNVSTAAMTDTPPPQQQPAAQGEEQQPDAAAASANASAPRAIRKAFLAVEQAEGAGARVRRSIGTPQLKNFSPFLMLDHFSVKPGAGFPDHPHRGQEVCSFLLPLIPSLSPSPPPPHTHTFHPLFTLPVFYLEMLTATTQNLDNHVHALRRL